MNSQYESRAFGFLRSRALSYHLDNYSRPDGWQDIGYELQYTFAVHFHRMVREMDRVNFIGKIIDVFKNTFGMAGEHYVLDVPAEEKVWELLESAGLVQDQLKKLEPPFDNISGFLFKVFWDKGPFDLRILKRLEGELNNLAILNHITIELANLIIIPRSRKTITDKVKGSSEKE